MKADLFYAILFLISLGFILPQITYAQTPVVCDSTYALCTTAKCTPIPGHPEEVLCSCDVKTGYSAGFKSCEQAKATVDNYQMIKSRYYPIEHYQVCSNKRAWANCLDMPCIIDKDNPEKASCMCTLVENKGDYIIVSDTCGKPGCDTGIYSSVLLKDRMIENLENLPKIKATLCK